MLRLSLLLLIFGVAVTARRPKYDVNCRNFMLTECIRFCPITYQPKCASNGVTYNSACQFCVSQCLMKAKKKMLHFRYPGRCISCDEKQPCRNVKYEVCGSDGKTYTNRCFLHKRNCRKKKNTKPIRVIYRGKCKSKEVDPCKKKGCPKIYKPVCGSNNKTYNNLCMLDRVNCEMKPTAKRIRVLYKGKCKSKEVDPCKKKECPKIYKPVCGSNRKTYPNKCVLDTYNCQRKPNSKRIRVLYKGKCKSKNVNPCKKKDCPMIYKPVCGSNKKTYHNKCVLDRHNCRRKPNSKRIRVLYRGKCGSKKFNPCKRKGCPKIYKPVCGSNKKTYPNKCVLDRHNCLRNPNDKRIRVQYRGPCKH